MLRTLQSEKPQGKRQLRRPRSKGEDNIKMALKQFVKAWTRFIWPRIETNGGLF